jgi:hypothetical protein
VALSPLAFSYEDAEWEKPKPGDKVMFAKFAGAAVKGKDGLDYRIINDKDVSAVLAWRSLQNITVTDPRPLDERFADFKVRLAFEGL